MVGTIRSAQPGDLGCGEIHAQRHRHPIELPGLTEDVADRPQLRDGYGTHAGRHLGALSALLSQPAHVPYGCRPLHPRRIPQWNATAKGLIGAHQYPAIGIAT
jgi:hypothetical protein